MKKIKKGIKELVKIYLLNSDDYVPIYSGDELLGFGKRGEQ
jgi:hypothetical protein